MRIRARQIDEPCIMNLACKIQDEDREEEVDWYLYQEGEKGTSIRCSAECVDVYAVKKDNGEELCIEDVSILVTGTDKSEDYRLF
jgi:hypothetical protein